MKTTISKIAIVIVAGIILACGAYFIYDKRRVEYFLDFNDKYQKAIFKNGKEALSDFNGEILSPRMDQIYRNSNGDSLTVFIKDGKRGFLNLMTKKVEISPLYEYAWQFDSESGLAAVCKNGRIGFIDTSGKIKIPLSYPFKFESLNDDEGFIFKNGTCIVPNKDKRGLINKNNELLLTPIYDEISDVNHEYRIVKLGDEDGLYNTNLNQLGIPLGDMELSFTENGIVVLENKPIPNQYLLDWHLKSTGTVFYIIEYIFKNDFKNDEAIDNEYDECGLPKTKPSGFSKYAINGKYGILEDLTGKVLCKPMFDDITYHSEGIFKANLDEYEFLVDRNGKTIN